MSFQLTSKNIRLVDNHILAASCQTREGGWQDASIDLNGYIGNEDGYFSLNQTNFAQSAEDVKIDSSTEKVSLVASLRRRNDQWNASQTFDLTELIENDDGTLRFVRDL
ncbi:MAG: Cyanovirin-N [Benniella sp.]|nr:MAG: Cyanovirin-N [Benniella sp.]